MDTVNSNTEAFNGRLSLFLSVALGILLSGCVTDARIPQIVFNTSVDDNCPVPEPNGGDDKFIHVKLYFQGDCPVKPDLDCVTVSQETGFKQKIRWQAYDFQDQGELKHIRYKVYFTPFSKQGVIKSNPQGKATTGNIEFDEADRVEGVFKYTIFTENCSFSLDPRIKVH